MTSSLSGQKAKLSYALIVWPLGPLQEFQIDLGAERIISGNEEGEKVHKRQQHKRREVKVSTSMGTTS